ncbi:MAG: imidazole glycerol phosphate synthase subunit HisH [Pseudomonadota bacterium]
MIRIVDYGLGNVQAFLNVYRRLNIAAESARTASELRDADKLILPGVGAFDHAMELLEGSGMRGALDEMVLARRVPVLGVCVGMQILAEGSDEGRRAGLGWLPGRVRSFRSLGQWRMTLPHMGWNDVAPAAANPLFSGLETDARFYFLHSYFFDCRQTEHVAARASYGIDFCCAVRAQNVYGVQFHPEKSHHFGTALLKNFALSC